MVLRWWETFQSSDPNQKTEPWILFVCSKHQCKRSKNNNLNWKAAFIQILTHLLLVFCKVTGPHGLLHVSIPQHVRWITFTCLHKPSTLHTTQTYCFPILSHLSYPELCRTGDDKTLHSRSDHVLRPWPAALHFPDRQHLHPDCSPHTSISPSTDRWAERWSTSCVKRTDDSRAGVRLGSLALSSGSAYP